MSARPLSARAHEPGAARHVFSQELTRLRVDEAAGVVEYMAGVRQVDLASEPGTHTQNADHLEPGGLSQPRAPGTGGGADEPDRPSTKDTGDVCGGTGEPVDRVLERAGEGVVVLGRDQQQPV